MVDESENREKGFDSSILDQRSYQLGMIYAFAEIVGSGCKRLALSPALTVEQFNAIWDDVTLIAEEFDLVLDVDDDFLNTRLFNPEYTKGKRVIHLAAERATLDEYRRLKELRKRCLEEGALTEEVDLELAWGLGRLLSYSDEAIRGLLDAPRFYVSPS
jgi:hypothetical protein